MKDKKVSCLTWLAIFLAFGVASGWFVQRRAPGVGPALLGGFIGAVMLIFAFSCFIAIFTRIAEWWLIVRARLGSEPSDGRRTALLGTLHGHGELHAPFTRERCVLYSYEITTYDVKDGETSSRTAYQGFAMVPLSIEHGASRTRILAKPDVPSLRRESPRSDAHAQQFVESTKFVDKPKDDPEVAHDGHLRYDWHTEPIETNIAACRIDERHLAPETSVCALGTYAEDRRALVGPVTLHAGSSTFVIDAAWRIVNAAIATVIFAAIAIVVAAVFCAQMPLDAGEQQRPDRSVAWWEIDLERLVDRHVRPRLLRMGALDTPGFYLQSVCDGCAKGKLEIDGRTIELRHARYAGNRSVHLSPRPNDRDGVTLESAMDGKKRVVLTIDGRSAPVPQSWIAEHDIATSLGSDGTYEGRITVIAPDHSIRCRVSFNTKVEADDWLR